MTKRNNPYGCFLFKHVQQNIFLWCKGEKALRKLFEAEWKTQTVADVKHYCDFSYVHAEVFRYQRILR